VEPVFTAVKVTPAPYRPRQSDVRTLLEGFSAEAQSLSDVSLELQRFAGIGGTPDPGAVSAVLPAHVAQRKKTTRR
jgi:hypothetical protein